LEQVKIRLFVRRVLVAYEVEAEQGREPLGRDAPTAMMRVLTPEESPICTHPVSLIHLSKTVGGNTKESAVCA